METTTKAGPKPDHETLYAETFKGDTGRDYVRIVGGNGEIVASSQRYVDEAGARAAAKRLAQATIVYRGKSRRAARRSAK